MHCEFLNGPRHPKGVLPVFFAGFGQDSRPFKALWEGRLPSEVLLVFAYSHADPSELKELISQHGYYAIRVVAWSLGVMMAQQLLAADYELSRMTRQALALNGTIEGIDRRYGINPLLYRMTLRRLSERTRADFYRRLFVRQAGRQEIQTDSQEAAVYLQNLPERSTDSMRAEMEFLQDRARIGKVCRVGPQLIPEELQERWMFSKGIISTEDAIFSPGAQRLSWCAHDIRRKRLKEQPHLPLDFLYRVLCGGFRPPAPELPG